MGPHSQPNCGEKTRWRPIFLVIVLVYAALASAMLGYLNRHSSFAHSTDTEAFITYALGFRSHGILADFGNIRTYGYPLFLSLLSVPLGLEPTKLLLGAGIVQTTLYAAAVWWLGSLVGGYTMTGKCALLVGLLLNPYIVSIVTDGVSDGLSLSLHIAAVATLTKVALARQFTFAALWLGVGAVIANFAIMVRPSNVVFVVGWFLAASISCVWRRPVGSTWVSLLAAHGFVWTLSAVALWYPQYHYNVRVVGVSSVFPGCPIGDLQLAYGILLLKYETLIRDGSAAPLYYLNPWFDGRLPVTLWHWYLERPLAGLATITGHLFAAFDIRHLFVYLHDDARTLAIVPFLGWMVNCTGVCGCAYWLRQNLPDATRRANWFPVLFFVVFVTAMTIMVNAMAAVESRLNLVPFAILSTAAAYVILTAQSQSRPALFKLLAMVVCCSLAAFYASAKLAALQSNELQLPSEDRSRLQFSCYHSRQSLTTNVQIRAGMDP